MLADYAEGIDISDYAIEFAKKLSHHSGIPADFVRADLFDWFKSNAEPFDVIYTSYEHHTAPHSIIKVSRSLLMLVQLRSVLLD